MEKLPQFNNNIVEEIVSLISEIKSELATQVNKALLKRNWTIGKIIVDNEVKYNNRLEYGKEILKELSNQLTKYIGKGYSVTNLKYMRMFYKAYTDFNLIDDRISFTHYTELMIISDINKRNFYEKEIINNKWSVRELQKQIEKSLFERLILSDGIANKEKVYKLAKEGQIIGKPEDILKEPFVFDFLGIKENKPLLEKDLEYKLIRHIEEFLLELGKGFLYQGSQQRITIGNNHYYVDMVFYNKFLKSYVLIDLKMGKLVPENIGQMNLYLNYYEQNINQLDDNKPVGIILCAEKDNIMMEIALGGLENKIFSSTYTYYIPDKEMLIREVEKVINKSDDE